MFILNSVADHTKIADIPPLWDFQKNKRWTQDHFFFLRFYLFMRDTQREAETQAAGEAGSLQGAGCRDSILGLQDYALSQRQILNCWANQASLWLLDFILNCLFHISWYLRINVFQNKIPRFLSKWSLSTITPISLSGPSLVDFPPIPLLRKKCLLS